MKFIEEQQLFDVKEAAKWCGLSDRAFYMHYKRGHIKNVPMLCHKLYFTRGEIDQFRSNYIVF